jgi:hypothetical protein
VASALSHLHFDGYTHGDLYAHNILLGLNGAPKLGDFGATFQYKGTAVADEPFERIEVRAFGCLAEEVAARVSAGERAGDGGSKAREGGVGWGGQAGLSGGAGGGSAGAGGGAAVRAALSALAARCMGPLSERPCFDEIVRELGTGT